MTENMQARKKMLARILPKRGSQSFGAIKVYPQKFTFETQNPGENVFILARAHVIVNLGWIVRNAILSVLPVLAISITNYLDWNFGFISSNIIAMALLIYYVSLLNSTILNLASWYYDLYLVTSERIIHYDFNPLASYYISEAEIENIQDVTQSTVGFLPNILGYGDVTVRTASRGNKFVFKAVPKPIWFADVVSDLARLVKTNEP